MNICLPIVATRPYLCHNTTMGMGATRLWYSHGATINYIQRIKTSCTIFNQSFRNDRMIEPTTRPKFLFFMLNISLDKNGKFVYNGMENIKISFFIKERGLMSENMKRLNIVISADLHKDLKVAAALNGITLQQFVSEAIAEKIKKEGSVNK